MAGVLPSPVPLNQYIAATMSSSSSSSSVSSSTSIISAVAAGSNHHNSNSTNNSNFKTSFLNSTATNNSCLVNTQISKRNSQPVSNFKILPSLRIKTNELFFKYLSEKDKTEQIKEIINFIKQSNSIPKLTDLQTFNKDATKVKSGLLSLNSLIGSSNDVLTQPHQIKQPPLHQNGSTSSISTINTNSTYPYNNQQITHIASSLNNIVNSHLRSKSPPSLHSPPMSPISRTPISPKSPRQRQSLLNNSNSNNNNNSQIINSALKIVNSFNKDQRPQSPRDDKLKTATTITAPNTVTATTLPSSSNLSPAPASNTPPANNTTTSNNAATTPTPNTTNLKVAVKPKNEKEIQIQRVSSSPTPSSNEPINNANNKPKSSPQPLSSQSLPVTTELNKNNFADLTPTAVNNKTPANVSNSLQVNGDSTVKTSTNNSATTTTNVQAIAAAVGASVESSNAKAKLQQQNAQMNNKILATLNSKIQQKQQQSVHIPQFHFPTGKPDEKQFKSADDTEAMKQVSAEFRLQKDGKIFKENFSDIMKLIGLPRYWKSLLFKACTNTSKLNYVTYSIFEQVWTKLNQTCHDRASLFLKLITSSNTIVYDDWEPLMQDIVDTHPGLKFLHDHKEFHTRYIKTVIARIYYTVNRSWSGKITLTELKRSNFLSVLESLEFEDDINLIKDYFSYEHFYVIYCKFWELDKDHDLYISKEDLYRHNNYAISPRVIDRIFSGTVIRGKDWRENSMSYYDFVWFLISEEDKRNPTSIEYWFRVLDMDGDGVLSMYELEYFYNEQIEQMKERQIEYMPFTDLLCQILDLVKPSESGKIHLKDLKQCKMTNVFFDTFINLEKYLEYEQRDPFSNMRDLDGPELTDWEKYAADEYENLVSEDVNADNQDFNYEDDFEDENMYNNANNSNGYNNLGTNGTNNNSNQVNSPMSQQQQQQQQQQQSGGSWVGNNNLAGDSQNASTGAANRNRLLLNNSPTSPTNTNTSSFITNRSSFDER